MKLVTIIGTRPQFIKAAVVSRAIGKVHEEILVHTGQHYDPAMSEIFFKELDLPIPKYNLGVGSGSHGYMTGLMLEGIEKILIECKPDAVIVYGDTNSTLAGALAASKLLIPVVHIEAGLRSYNMRMPEEQNRVLTDHISTLLFCPTETAVENLNKEGITKGVYNTGDIMYDGILHYLGLAEKTYSLEDIHRNLTPLIQGSNLKDITIESKKYYLATIHRAENTDSSNRLSTILDAFNSLDAPVYFPTHPRTLKIVKELSLSLSNIYLFEPVGYLQMLILIRNAKKVLTDSGGLQKEAYFLDTHCLTLRDQTEWVETLENGWNSLSSINKDVIIEKATNTRINKAQEKRAFGNGKAAIKMIDLINDYFL